MKTKKTYAFIDPFDAMEKIHKALKKTPKVKSEFDDQILVTDSSGRTQISVTIIFDLKEDGYKGE